MREERIRELAEKLEDDWFDVAPSASEIEAALREVWNEAVEECAKVVGKQEVQIDGPCAGAEQTKLRFAMEDVRSLKLPEGK